VKGHPETHARRAAVLRSMTGYGSAERTDGGLRVRVEIRSVNQRFLDLQIKGPRQFLQIEDRIRKTVEGALGRGRVTVYIESRDESEAAAPAVNMSVARKLMSDLRELASDLDLPGEVDVGVLSRFPQLLDTGGETPSADALWGVTGPAVEEAVRELVAMREREGREILVDLTERIDAIDRAVGEVESSAPEVTLALKERIAEKIRSLVEATVPVDDARLAQEVAIAAERADYTEEVVRLKAHVGQVRQCFESDGPVGKRLNFLVQEMHREANTIGSKTADLGVSQSVLFLKEEIEKVREQVQNVE
jgi:uncharacterized protein (TIGR00255 family)